MGAVIGQKNPKKIKFSKSYSTYNQAFTNDSIPLNGYYKIKHIRYCPNPEKEISYFKNGFREGLSKELHRNKLERAGEYSRGLKTGAWKYYSNGELKTTSEYINGKKTG